MRPLPHAARLPPRKGTHRHENRAGGSTTLTLRFSKKAKRTLARSRRARLTVKIRFTADGAKTTESAGAAIRLR